MSFEDLANGGIEEEMKSYAAILFFNVDTQNLEEPNFVESGLYFYDVLQELSQNYEGFYQILVDVYKVHKTKEGKVEIEELKNIDDYILYKNEAYAVGVR